MKTTMDFWLDIAPWIFGFGPFAVILYAQILHPLLFPSVWDRAYTLGYADGLTGRPADPRRFQSRDARKGYKAGIADAALYLDRQEQKQLRESDRMALYESRRYLPGGPGHASRAQADTTTP
jgi:ribosome modulation factor